MHVRAAPREQPLPPIVLTEPGVVARVHGRAFVSQLPVKIAHGMAAAATRRLREWWAFMRGGGGAAGQPGIYPVVYLSASRVCQSRLRCGALALPPVTAGWLSGWLIATPQVVVEKDVLDPGCGLLLVAETTTGCLFGSGPSSLYRYRGWAQR